MEKLIAEFRSRLTLPAQKVVRPFLLGVIGNLGSGKSTLARMLAARLVGSVVVTADSARYLLKEHGLSWGDNVRALVRGVAERLIKDDYAVIFDGSSAESEERRQTAEMAEYLKVPVWYVRIMASYETCRDRLKAKYDDQSWASSFERFRVGPTDKMLANLEQRQVLHTTLQDENIVGLVGVVQNDGDREGLEQQAKEVSEKILGLL